MVIRLSDIALDCGALTRAIYDTAPGGYWGKFVFGYYRGVRVAVKILAPKSDVPAQDADVAFKTEAAIMLAARCEVDRARVRLSLGAQLSEPCDLPDASLRCSEPHDIRGHKHVVLVYGVGTEPDLSALSRDLPPGPAHLIVMEELTGGTLEAWASSPRAIDEVQKVAAELASGLAFLAAAHVVHADLKASNVMLREPGGDVVLTDFGIGHVSDSGVGVVLKEGSANKNMQHLAPELVDGGRANTFASDIYSYGLVLWCLLSGSRYPYEVETGAELPDLASIFTRVRAGHRPDLAALRPDTPCVITALIQRCWAQDPAARPTALDITREFDRWFAAPGPVEP